MLVYRRVGGIFEGFAATIVESHVETNWNPTTIFWRRDAPELMLAARIPELTHHCPETTNQPTNQPTKQTKHNKTKQNKTKQTNNNNPDPFLGMIICISGNPKVNQFFKWMKIGGKKAHHQSEAFKTGSLYFKVSIYIYIQPLPNRNFFVQFFGFRRHQQKKCSSKNDA